PITANIPVGLLSYDLTAAHGVGASDYKIAWVFNGNTFGLFYWSIDDVMVNGPRANVNRSFEFSKVFLDGQLVTETTDNEYQYDVANLTPYETYTAGVAAVYSTGQSTTEEFDFIYVPCGDYDTPTAFTAEQTIGTLDVVLNWTNVDAAALDTIAGVVVYRNGEEYADLDFEDGVVASFTDEDLEFGTYNYCLTYVYDSGAETCQGVVCSEDVVVTGGGYVNGTVTAFDGGAAIEGATVLVFNDDFSFEFTTDLLGYYEGEVIDGTYDYAVSATAFESQLLEDVTITFGETVTTDFQLLEFPYPVSSVMATEVNDNSVLVDWGAQVPVVSEWLVYDADVLGFSGIGAEVADYSLIWASKFVPAQLTEYGTGFVTKVSVYQYDLVGDYLTEVRILGGENGETVLYSQDVTGTLAGTAWNVIE
ncbi:MAG: carboxypeptidase-like regulatory domain-containing protein, partial [Bacteroidales bacterium]|nr:carboxypeptidase-like regulatory domain-containing protein [Bacteroidales bacterium]